MRVHVLTRNRIHQSGIVLVRWVPGSSPTAAILESEKTLGTRLLISRLDESSYCGINKVLWVLQF